MTKRIYIPPQDIGLAEVFVRGAEAHHLRDVLRAVKGDKVTVFDGKGREYDCRISLIDSKEVLLKIQAGRFMLSKEAPYSVALAQAVLKNARIDFVIQKATELGVDKIIPVYAARSVVRLDPAKAKGRVKRWQKIAQEASRQCGRPRVPVVGDCVGVKDAIESLKGCDLKLFFCINKGTAGIKGILERFSGKPPATIAVFIGPEGDFTDEEIAAAKGAGYHLASLGCRVLRAETAGLYLLSVLDYVFGL